MKIHGWGNYSVIDAQVLKPKKINDIKELIKINNKVIARGLGRSYGDSANNNIVIDTTSLNQIIKFDTINGLISCESGVSIQEINKLTIPYGWFVPVTPGSSYVTLGGAISSDIHGKNHHIDGAFSDHIVSANLMLSDGEIITISKTINNELFQATCGGMGLTGIIVSATFKLKSINSNLIKQTTIKSSSLEELFNQLEVNFSSPYSVAWVDFSKKINQ
jgi:FAD/FMN-containing dehydrogenase